MEINSLFNNAAADQKQPVSNPKTQLGKEDFLKLLTVQLRYQDPMNPLENTEFIAQMSQFSSLEQLQNMNQTMGQNLESENRLHTAYKNNIATSLIGKNVEIPTREIEYNGDDPAILTYRLGEGTHKASAQILDARGQLVRSLVLDSSSSHGSVSWDGKSQADTEVPAGVYRVIVQAEGVDGKSVAGQALKGVRVQAVRNLGGEAKIWADDREISLSELSGVTESSR